MRRLKQKSKETIGKAASDATRWIGSTSSIIVHTLLFAGSFLLVLFGINFEKILLVVTTIVSLEAIYLSIFIQMSVNQQQAELREVAEDVGEIQENVDEIQEDVEEIEKDIDEIQEDVEEIQEEDADYIPDPSTLTKIENTLEKLINEIAELKKEKDSR